MGAAFPLNYSFHPCVFEATFRIQNRLSGILNEHVWSYAVLENIFPGFFSLICCVSLCVKNFHFPSWEIKVGKDYLAVVHSRLQNEIGKILPYIM